MNNQGPLAYPIVRYRLLTHPEQSTLAVIAFETAGSPSFFAVTREMLEELAEAFLRHSVSMPTKADQN